MTPFDSVVDAPALRAPATTEPAQADTVAARMRKLFGPNGEHWIKRDYVHLGNFCLVGAVGHLIQDNETCGKALDILELACGAQRIEWFNDARSTTFSDILRVLDRMEEIELAERSR